MRDFHIVTSPAQIPDGSKLALGLSSHAIKLPGKSPSTVTGWMFNKESQLRRRNIFVASLSPLHNLFCQTARVLAG